MTDDVRNVDPVAGDIELGPTIGRAIQQSMPSERSRAIEGVAVAALASIPWVGGVFAAAAAFKEQGSTLARDQLVAAWLDEHGRLLGALRRTLDELQAAFERLGPGIEARLESDEYLGLVRRAFRAWDRAESGEKRKLIANLIANAAGSQLADDDLVRLFIDWLDTYDETHFAVISAVYNSGGITRGEIWDQMGRGPRPADNAADADLFRKLIDDLSRGRVIRQHREIDQYGQFIAKPRAPRRGAPASGVLKSAFDSSEVYELTALGEKFVHYVLTGIVTRIATGANTTEGWATDPSPSALPDDPPPLSPEDFIAR